MAGEARRGRWGAGKLAFYRRLGLQTGKRVLDEPHQTRNRNQG